MCTISKQQWSCKVIDCGGKSNYRSLWQQFIQPNETAAITFVIDSLDKQRLGIAIQELQQLIRHVQDHVSSNWYQSLKKSYQADTKPLFPILVLCNKQNEQQSISLEHLKVLCNVQYNPQHIELQVMGCNAKSGVGVEDAWEWLRQRCRVSKSFVK